MHGNRHRAHFNFGGRSRLRVTLAAAAIVLVGTALGACNREETSPVASSTNAADAGERRGDEPPELSRVGEIQPGNQARPALTPTTVKTPSTLTERQDPIPARGHACPMAIRGAKVEAEDTADGIALIFTSAGSEVDELREQVQQLSQVYAAGERRGPMMWRRMGHGRGEGRHAGMGPATESGIPEVTVEVEDTDRGARMELTPTDPTQLTSLRELVRFHQQRLNAGECWMAREQGARAGSAPRQAPGEPGEGERPGAEERPGA